MDDRYDLKYKEKTKWKRRKKPDADPNADKETYDDNCVKKTDLEKQSKDGLILSALTSLMFFGLYAAGWHYWKKKNK